MNTRYAAASQYLSTLEVTLKRGWLDVYESNSLCRYEKLALLHPDHLEELDLPQYSPKRSIRQKVQGGRSFTPVATFSKCCNSKLLWGYDCELDGEMQQDHLFPYSLGGPTDGKNRIWLCQYHNMVKTCDVHCFPWEAAEKWCDPWLDSQIEKLRVEFEQFS